MMDQSILYSLSCKNTQRSSNYVMFDLVISNVNLNAFTDLFFVRFPWWCAISRVLRRFVMRNERTGEWRKLHKEELHYLYSSQRIIRIIKSRMMRFTL
jgi:hypothetical protein